MLTGNSITLSIFRIRMRTLVLITSQFPFGTGEPFLETELPVISPSFDKIIVIAQDIEHEKTRDIPGNFKLFRYNTTTTISGYLRLPLLLLRNLPSLLKNYWRELNFRRKRSGFLSIEQKKILIKKLIKGVQLKDYIKGILRDENIQGQTVLYSYWLKTGSHAIAMLHCDSCIKIARAHGSDLYEENTHSRYLPLIKLVSDNLDAIFFISENGMNYFQEKTGTVKPGFILSRLGVNRNNPVRVTLSQKSDIFNIVSCSNILPLKRIDLIIYALEKIEPGKRVHWVHFGDGILRKEMEKLASEKLGNKKIITYAFMGHYPNTDLLEYYSKNRIDLFINTSSTEGLPVSIMEAQSFGIPVIATDVGGVKEVVPDGTGILLPVNFLIDELVDNIQHFIDMPETEINIFRNKALNNWENYFNATSNYQGFLTKLNSILASSTES